MQTTDERVLALLSRKPHTTHEMMLALGVTKRTVRHAISRLGERLAYDLGKMSVRHYRLPGVAPVRYVPIKITRAPSLTSKRRKPSIHHGVWAGL